MARVKKYKVYSKKIRSEVQFRRIEGTSLKVSKTVYSKWLKGTVSDAGLAKSIAKANPKLGDLWQFPAKRLASLSYSNQAGKEGFINAIKAAYRTQLHQFDPDTVLRESLPEIINKSLSEKEINKLKSALNENELQFSDWHWNDEKKIFEKVTSKHTYWIKVHRSNYSGDYDESDVEYGKD